MQPELRAIDAYNWKERLVEWVRGFGVTTVHTGHSPGELISGQTCIVKTAAGGCKRISSKRAGCECDFGRRGTTVWKFSGEPIQGSRHVRPSHDWQKNDWRSASEDTTVFRNLREEMLEDIASGDRPLIVHADRAFDISAALRLKKEFGLDVVLESAAEAHGMIDAIKEANVPSFAPPWHEVLENA